MVFHLKGDGRGAAWLPPLREGVFMNRFSALFGNQKADAADAGDVPPKAMCLNGMQRCRTDSAAITKQGTNHHNVVDSLFLCSVLF